MGGARNQSCVRIGSSEQTIKTLSLRTQFSKASADRRASIAKRRSRRFMRPQIGTPLRESTLRRHNALGRLVSVGIFSNRSVMLHERCARCHGHGAWAIRLEPKIDVRRRGHRRFPCGELLDRLLHNAETIVITGKSYRMKDQIEPLSGSQKLGQEEC